MTDRRDDPIDHRRNNLGCSVRETHNGLHQSGCIFVNTLEAIGHIGNDQVKGGGSQNGFIEGSNNGRVGAWRHISGADSGYALNQSSHDAIGADRENVCIGRGPCNLRGQVSCCAITEDACGLECICKASCRAGGVGDVDPLKDGIRDGLKQCAFDGG